MIQVFRILVVKQTLNSGSLSNACCQGYAGTCSILVAWRDAKCGDFVEFLPCGKHKSHAKVMNNPHFQGHQVVEHCHHLLVLLLAVSEGPVALKFQNSH